MGLQLTRTSNNLQFNFSVFSKCWVTWWMSEREYFLWKTWSQACSLLLTGEHHLGYFDHFFFIARNYQTVANGDEWLIVTDPPLCFLLTITDYFLYYLLSMFITDYYWLWLSMLILLLIMIWVLLDFHCYQISVMI